MAKHYLVELPDWEDDRIDAGYIRSVLSASDANVVEVVDASACELAKARAEIERLRAGEDHTPAAEGVELTPGQLIAKWNSLNATERLEQAARILDDNRAARECFLMNHRARLEEAERQRRRAALAADYEAALAKCGLLPDAAAVELVRPPDLASDTCTVKFTARVPAALEAEGQAWLEGWAERFLAHGGVQAQETAKETR
jgi:hypothetical protein